MAKTCAGRGFEVLIGRNPALSWKFRFSADSSVTHATQLRARDSKVPCGPDRALSFCGSLLMSRPSRGYVCRGPSSLVFRAAFFTLAAHMCDLLLERLRFLPHFSVCA